MNQMLVAGSYALPYKPSQNKYWKSESWKQGPGPSSRSEEDDKEDVSEEDSGKPERLDIEELSWDELLIEDDNDEEMMDWSK
jgi:hypothetical protein